MFRERVPSPRNPDSKLILLVISAKEDVNPPSFKKALLLPDKKYQQEHCILMPCWTFLFRLVAGSWRDLHLRVGNRPAFLFSAIPEK